MNFLEKKVFEYIDVKKRSKKYLKIDFKIYLYIRVKVRYCKTNYKKPLVNPRKQRKNENKLKIYILKFGL